MFPGMELCSLIWKRLEVVAGWSGVFHPAFEALIVTYFHHHLMATKQKSFGRVFYSGFLL